MPVTYKIFKDPVLVYIRYSGKVELPQIARALGQFAKEGAAYQRQPHLLDLSHVTSYDIDYPEFFRFMGHLADAYPQSTGEHLFVFLAPEGAPAHLGEILIKPFLQSPTILVRMARTQEHAFEILGETRADVLQEMNSDPKAVPK